MAQANSQKVVYLNLGGKFILTAVFIYAAYSKILDPEIFIKNVKQYKILPEFLINPFGHSLPFLELLSSVLLWIPQWLKPALLSFGLMLLLFIVAISYAILSGNNIDCGCSNFDLKIGPLHLIIDVILFIVTILLYLFADKNKTISTTTGV